MGKQKQTSAATLLTPERERRRSSRRRWRRRGARRPTCALLLQKQICRQPAALQVRSDRICELDLAGHRVMTSSGTSEGLRVRPLMASLLGQLEIGGADKRPRFDLLRYEYSRCGEPSRHGGHAVA